MNEWVYLISFIYPHEANLVKLNLESEGIEVWMKDELTVQVNNYLSNAVGGVKLYVKENDYEKARVFLIEAGNITPENQHSNKWLTKIEALSHNIPLLKTLRFEIRLFILIAFLLLAIISVLVLLTYKHYY